MTLETKKVNPMPARPKRPCAAGSMCPHLVEPPERYCPDHKHMDKQYDKERGSAARRGYGRKWQEVSRAYLRQHFLCECEECRNNGRPELSEVVDHRIPHKGDQKLFWDRTNWMAMSKRHHDRKTAREDGAFGNPAKR